MSHQIYNLLGRKILSSKKIFFVCQNNDQQPDLELIYHVGAPKESTSITATILHYLLKTFFTPIEERSDDIAIYHIYSIHKTSDDKLIFKYNTYVHYDVINVQYFS